MVYYSDYEINKLSECQKRQYGIFLYESIIDFIEQLKQYNDLDEECMNNIAIFESNYSLMFFESYPYESLSKHQCSSFYKIFTDIIRYFSDCLTYERKKHESYILDTRGLDEIVASIKYEDAKELEQEQKELYETLSAFTMLKNNTNS